MVQILICLLTRAYGTQRQISNYYCSLPCKVDSFRMKVKKYLGLRISRYPHSTSTFQLSCLTISGDICPNPGPSGKPNSPQAIAGLYLNARSVKAFVPLDGNPGGGGGSPQHPGRGAPRKVGGGGGAPCPKPPPGGGGVLP